MTTAVATLPLPVRARILPVPEWKRVRRAPRYEVRADGLVRNRDTGRVLSPYLNSRVPGEDYYRLSLSLGGGKKLCVYHHRLIGLYHTPGRTRERRIPHHIGPGPDPFGRPGPAHHHNVAWNFRWVTPAENAALRWDRLQVEPWPELGEAPF